MSLLLKNAKIFNEQSRFHDQIVDTLINDAGTIERIGSDLPATDQTKDCGGAQLSVGWFDLRAHFSDPGDEHKEDMGSGLNAAAAGGFTDVGLLPNTSPVTGSKGDIAYLKNKANKSATQVHPYGAITKGARGEDFTEMLDLHHAGAAAFTDGLNPVWNTDILLKTLQYLKQVDAQLMSRPKDKWLSMFGVMHEGLVSTSLGMKGIPGLAEEIMIERDLSLLKYAGGKIHFSCLSSAGSIELIRAAKKEGLQVTCDVPVYHLVLTDESIAEYDTYFKVDPPLRSERDRIALIEGVIDGTVDAIVSNHIPQDEESKKLEFDLADDGMISLQSVFSNLVKASGELPLTKGLQCLTEGPRRVLGLPAPKFEEGAKACFTLFDPKKSWIFDSSTNQSKSNNSPWLGQELQGKVMGVVNGTNTYWNQF